MYAERDMPLVMDMLKHGRLAMEFVRGKTFNDYREDLVLQAAVERKVEIVGEAARHISKEFQANHHEIPWRLIMAQRHILAHDYGEIVGERVWQVATTHMPKLLALLEQIVTSPSE